MLQDWLATMFNQYDQIAAKLLPAVEAASIKPKIVPPIGEPAAVKRYHRFADGDSGQFFTQLLLVLDVHAHYAERIPARMISANADSLATLQEMREEIGLIAKTIESRDVNITNHAEKTDELCRVTVAKCNETIGRIELMM